ncbi:MAG: cytochrome c [Vicinamibacterales bacterium]
MNHEAHDGLEGNPRGPKRRVDSALFVLVVGFVASCVLVSLARGASVWDGVYSEEQAKRGETIYYERCAVCHGAQLEGGDMTPSLVGGVFTSTWNDLPLSDLFERIRITMPLNQPSTLSRQQTADVTAFLLKSNKWPAGQTELPRELEPLKEIQIQALKP